MRGSNNFFKTHCPRGHAYIETNTKITDKGGRQCRKCAQDWDRRRRHSNNCGVSGCNEKCLVNPKTNKPFSYCEKHRQDSKNRNLRVRERLRQTFLEMYGGVCQCCGIDQPVFLSLDHVRDNGSEHRKERGGLGVYRDAIADFNPDEYQILCHNCNFAKYVYGVCPHALSLGGIGNDI